MLTHPIDVEIAEELRQLQAVLKNYDVPPHVLRLVRLFGRSCFQSGEIKRLTEQIQDMDVREQKTVTS
jgi:hypothetical protein